MTESYISVRSIKLERNIHKEVSLYGYKQVEHNFKKHPAMKKTTLLIVILVSFFIINKTFPQSTERPEINIVYGKKHIYTIETPSGWINDKEVAKKYGLVNFFYHKSDSLIKQKSYIYAFGIDKDTPTETLDGFI